MISTPEECGYDASDGETGNVTGGMEGKDETVHIVEDPKRTGTLSERAVQFIRSQTQAGNPFYLQVSYYAAHLRVEALASSIEKYEKKGIPDRAYTTAWAGMLGELDTGVGRVLDTLDELGITGNTYVVFMADNGGRGDIPGGDQSRKPTNFPLTGAKHSLYEGGVRVPFMVRGPGIKPGSVCHTPVTGYDLMPTFYDLAGGKAPLPDEVDGTSIRPLLNDPAKGKLARSQNAIFFHRPNKGFSTVRQGDYKLMLNWNNDGSIKSRELYKLDPNPREATYNIAQANPEKVAQLERILLAHLDRVNAEKPTPPPAKKSKKKKA
jgi:arylsulfatase A-like enzyme